MFRQFIKENRFLYFFLAFYFLIGGVLLSQIQKGDVVIWVNQYHTSYLDFFFKYFTKAGEEILLFVVIISLFFFKRRYMAVILLLNILLNGAIIQILKHTIFADYMRPVAILGKEGYHFVQGVHVNSYNSFPSGHTNSAFAFLILMAFFTKNSFFKILLAITAIMIGFSRVYLFQHFFVDTYAGGIIGVLLTTIFYFYIENYTSLKTRLTQK